MKNKKGKKGFYFKDYKDSDLFYNKNPNIIKVSLNRVTFLAFIFISLITIFSFKIIYLSLSPEQNLITKNIKNNPTKNRRDIIDRNGSILATNVVLYDVGVRPQILNKKEKKNLLIKLGLLFPEINIKKIEQKLNNDKFFS